MDDASALDDSIVDDAIASLDEQARKLRLGQVHLLRLSHLIDQMGACLGDLDKAAARLQRPPTSRADEEGRSPLHQPT